MTHRTTDRVTSRFLFGVPPELFVLALMIAFTFFFGGLAVQQHRAFLTNGLDIGNVDQALWNTAQGRFLAFSLMAPVESRLALHVEPLLLFFVPFYWLGWGSPELLLAVQAAVVAVGAWPLYRLAVIQLGDSRNGRASLLLPLIFPLAYLLLPTLESAVLFDFHAVTMAPAFLLFAFLALEQQHPRRFFLFAVLAMACKEDMPLVVAMLGLYAGLAQRRWKLAGVAIGVSALWFAAAVLVIQPAFAAEGNIQLERYAWLGDSLPAMLVTLVTQPGLVIDHLWQQAGAPAYLARLFFPTAFLALLNPLTLLPMLPTLAVNLLSDNPFTWRLEDFHYGAPLAPFLFISTIYGIRRLSAWFDQGEKNRAALAMTLGLLVLCFSGVYHYHRGFTPLARPYYWPPATPHHQTLEAVLAAAPAKTPLFVQSNLAPHLSQRPVIHADFAYFTDSDFPTAAPLQSVLLDVTTLENFGGLHQFLQQTLLAEGSGYRLVEARDGILHLQAVAGETGPVVLPPEFFTFTDPSHNLLDYPLHADFGDAVRLRGYSLHFNRQEEVQVTVDLEPLRPLVDVQPVLYLLDAAGRPLGAAADLPPALAWRPVEAWVMGQPVRVRFNTLPWHTRDMAGYRLALGLISGADPWAVAQRHRPAVADETPLVVRLPESGTLLELAAIRQPWQMPHGGPLMRRFDRPAAPHPVQASFGGQVQLFGHSRPVIQPGIDGEPDLLSVSLYWQALSRPDSLIRFVQFVGADGQLYGQQDSLPDRGQYPTELWQPGQVVIETVTFPLLPDRPGSGNLLHVGLYQPDSGARLLHAGGDHVAINVPDFGP